jgi:hypothetical protein
MTRGRPLAEIEPLPAYKPARKGWFAGYFPLRSMRPVDLFDDEALDSQSPIRGWCEDGRAIVDCGEGGLMAVKVEWLISPSGRFVHRSGKRCRDVNAALEFQRKVVDNEQGKVEPDVLT